MPIFSQNFRKLRNCNDVKIFEYFIITTWKRFMKKNIPPYIYFLTLIVEYQINLSKSIFFIRIIQYL